MLPPRSTAGQLTLDQHIGVRIPGGQPNFHAPFREAASKTIFNVATDTYGPARDGRFAALLALLPDQRPYRIPFESAGKIARRQTVNDPDTAR